MATARTFIHAAPEDVFNVLSNADAYEYWVVGCQEIRDADEAFPEPGSSFEHRIGATVHVCARPRVPAAAAQARGTEAPLMRLGFAVKVLGDGGLPSHDTRRWQSGPHLRVPIERLHA